MCLIKFGSWLWVDWFRTFHLGSIATEKFIRDKKLWEKEEVYYYYFFLVPSRRSENKETINIFKIITYFQDTISIHLITLDPRCDIVINWIWTVPIKFHSWIKILLFFLTSSIGTGDLCYTTVWMRREISRYSTFIHSINNRCGSNVS